MVLLTLYALANLVMSVNKNTIFVSALSTDIDFKTVLLVNVEHDIKIQKC